MRKQNELRQFHAARWNEPIVMELGRPGARGQVYGQPEAVVSKTVGDTRDLIPPELVRKRSPDMPELTEFEVQRHFLHLSQQTLGMMGISLFGTCTMKYSSKMAEAETVRAQVSETHPYQHGDTLQGTLEVIHDLDRTLRVLSGMDQFVFQAGGGADAAYTMCAVARAYFQAKGELDVRDEVITSVQAHPCNPATAAAAGFKVINLPLTETGYPSLEALKAAVSERTAMLMIGNPDDMGIYNPQIKEWVRIVKEAGGLSFYDHANFNGVMGKLAARELGFDACMFMLHKTFGGAKGGGGPAVGAFGCSPELAPFLPAPVVVKVGDKYHADMDRPQSCGKIREFWGNVPLMVRAYAWTRSLGAEGIDLASDISVVANNYIDHKLSSIRGLQKSHPEIKKWRMEMTRWGLGPMKLDTGVGTAAAANRLADFGIDPWWMSHEPWILDEPFTPEAGELWSKDDIDQWIAAVQRISDEAYSDPAIILNAPYNQPISKAKGTWPGDPDRWAMTWRAYVRKHRGAELEGNTAA
ncbi:MULTISPECIES: aminomethyl-transferring glycine dehydrogenase subunit GcvPB [unclassified Mesorhizobium]|uniref:aminomethyl-transferring glycine dehydrogenase subunit GcvPB n=1 Tax=unclassified Mesorhizobium TaxID=325217 RepID=UPI002414ECA0|nr:MULTISPECIES: aminomethyl-transferring glycine dehydrogenase subunit GcvPB [unclassified Mesorhizobium]MDG4890101.1 aminomethyl-transferring glycine dehydrogenase subunit GcvPB [Mesorhizobium sp. WSM4887]MDG4904243.1 aminomethyl-transferring glycine dehydrogenase subunit GcvPB [Mesorhizobium sp. WSM4962]MDG4909270.1 aminomethyl-transferring glycine dehydrogenase subunit GcvPB [Mesorhizobium sp. WSM4898]MDG4921894.1 aminomethyl-transferring glycine dehydrogenase subunit GcvPB [Mesorhizobium s